MQYITGLKMYIFRNIYCNYYLYRYTRKYNYQSIFYETRNLQLYILVTLI